MKIAVISDIHSNLVALRTALSHIKLQQVDRIICLGDAVGYGPRPNECVELLRRNSYICLMGNHDHAVLGLTDTRYFNSYAREAVEWTRSVLTPENLDYLRNLPFFFSENDFLFVHSTPLHPEDWEYIFSENQARDYIKQMKQRICFVGHSHVPMVFPEHERSYYREESILEFREQKYIVNVGSVGQPRDHDPRLCYVLFDTESGWLKFVRLKYDYEETAREILEKGLPPFLAMRLAEGY